MILWVFYDLGLGVIVVGNTIDDQDDYSVDNFLFQDLDIAVVAVAQDDTKYYAGVALINKCGLWEYDCFEGNY